MADAPLTAGQLSAVGGSEGAGGASAAFTFTDANPDAAASDFQATVDWGDGSSSSAPVTQNPDGSFSVSPTAHTVGEEGTYTVTVLVTDRGGSRISATQKVTVTDAPLTGSGAATDLSPGVRRDAGVDHGWQPGRQRVRLRGDGGLGRRDKVERNPIEAR